MADKELSILYDQRTLNHHFRNGTITRKEYESYLKSLDDSESNAEYIDPFEETQGNEDSSGLTFAPVEQSK
jgi:hypothetical protein